MQIIVSYIIKCVVTSGILTGYYYAVLRNKKFNAYNRAYLLATIAISLVTPFIHTGWFTIQPSPNNTLTTVITVIASPQKQPAAISAASIAFICAALVSLALLVILLAKVLWIYRVKKRSQATKMHGYQLVETDVKQAPFSFLDNLFWRNGISLTDEGWQKVLHHELVHIKQRHTYDKLFAQITVCIFWMNPFYWLIQRELTMIHEFIADEGSIKDGDTEAFAIMLLQAHNQGRYLNPQHSFFHSPIKRRLIMLTTSKHTPYSYMRRVLAIPVACAVVLLFSATISHAQTEPKVKEVKQLKLENDSAHLIRLALKQTGGKFDTTQIKEIRLAPAKNGAEGKGKLQRVTTDEGVKQIIFTRKNSTKDTVTVKNAGSTAVKVVSSDIVFASKQTADTSKPKSINLTPVEVVGYPSKTGLEAKPATNKGKDEVVVVGYSTRGAVKTNTAKSGNKINTADSKPNEIVVIGYSSKSKQAKPAADSSKGEVIEVVGYPAKRPAKQ